MPRLELLDGPKVVHGSLLAARTAEHLRVELCTQVDEALFEGGVLALEMDGLRAQFNHPSVELVHEIHIIRVSTESVDEASSRVGSKTTLAAPVWRRRPPTLSESGEMEELRVDG